MKSHVLKYFYDNNILFNFQFGFRQVQSTSPALIEITDQIKKTLDDKDYGGGLYTDLQKAFHVVNHSLYWIME